MRRIFFKITILVFSVILVCCLCFRKDLHRITIGYDKGIKQATCYISSNGDKTVIFVPMFHVGSIEYRDKLHYKLDSLKNNGFVTFVENVQRSQCCSDTSRYHLMADVWNGEAFLSANETDDLMDRKLRYIFGFDTKSNYKESSSPVVMKSIKQNRRVYLGTLDLGLTTAQDYWTDYSTADIIHLVEKKYGLIPLTKYDYKIPVNIGAKYRQFGIKQLQIRYDAIFTFREEYLLQKINNAPFDKIVVIYGAAHTRYFDWQFRKKNSGWHKVKDFQL